MKNYGLLKDYLLKNAARVFKEPTGDLHYPFIDPGSGYEGELWDWDSYFTAKGICEMFSLYSENELRAAGLTRERAALYMKGSVLNFFAAQEADGYVPIMAAGGGLFKGYFHAEHEKGTPLNQHKPFLCQAALQAAKFCGDDTWIDTKKLASYLAYYERNQFDPVSGLYFWQDDIMIGIDNNPTVFYRQPRSCADIYLNSLLVLEYESFAEILRRKGEDDSWTRERTNALKQAIEREMWDERDGIYYSQDIAFYQTERKIGDFSFHEGLAPSWNTLPLKVRFWGCFLPLYAGVCAPERAVRLCEHFSDKNVFAKFGIRTLARNEKMYNLEKSSNPSNWLGAIWVIANYLVYEGLKRYRQNELAEKLKQSTCELLENSLHQYGDLYESYQPDTGEPNLHAGFLSWNLLAAELLK